VSEWNCAPRGFDAPRLRCGGSIPDYGGDPSNAVSYRRSRRAVRGGGALAPLRRDSCATLLRVPLLADPRLIGFARKLGRWPSPYLIGP